MGCGGICSGLTLAAETFFALIFNLTFLIGNFLFVFLQWLVWKLSKY